MNDLTCRGTLELARAAICSGASVLAIATPICAQTEQPEASPSARSSAPASEADVQRANPDEEGDSGEITITARRRAESLQDVPISVAAFSTETLQDRQVNSTEQLTQIAANVQFSAVAPSSGNPGSSAIFIRGVGQSDFIASTDPGVGFYVDNVYFARASGTAISLLDVDRIEVLRGPQGTLFGRNTVGGAIQIFSRRPTFDGISGHVRFTGGTYGRIDAEAVVNLPVSETFAVRLAAIKRTRDGYVRNILNGRRLGDIDTFATRASLLWRPSESTEVTLIADYTLDKSHGSPTVFGGITTSAAFVRFASFVAGCPGVAGPPAVTPVPENNDPRCANNQYLALGPYQVAANAPSRSRNEMYGGVLTIEQELTDWMTARSITAYRRTRPFSIRDADNTPLRILETVNSDDIKQFTQEFQFLGVLFDGRLNYQFGAYYFRETDYQFYPVYLPTLRSAVTGEELLVGGLNSSAYIKNKSFALFTQESIDITDKLNLTVGLRYTKDIKEVLPDLQASPTSHGFINVGYNVAYPPGTLAGQVCLGPPIPGSGSPVPRSPPNPCVQGLDPIYYTYMFNPVLNKKSGSSLTPAASLQYEWSPNFMTYVSYSQGYKSGGFNTRIIQPVKSPEAPTGREFLPSFDPEKVKSYELGAKIQMGRMLRLSGAVFRSKYSDIHIVVREGVAPVVRNAGKATIDGFELEGTLRPTPPFEINFGVGYTNFGYDSFTAALEAGQITLAPGALGRVDLDDMQAYTPKWSLTGGIAYEFDLGFATLTPRLDAFYRSKTYFDAPNTEQIAQRGYALVNALVRLQDKDKRWRLTAGVTNLTDKAYRVSGNSSLTAASGYAEVTYGSPRMWTLEGQFNF